MLSEAVVGLGYSSWLRSTCLYSVVSTRQRAGVKVIHLVCVCLLGAAYLDSRRRSSLAVWIPSLTFVYITFACGSRRRPAPARLVIDFSIAKLTLDAGAKIVMQSSGIGKTKYAVLRLATNKATENQAAPSSWQAQVQNGHRKLYSAKFPGEWRKTSITYHHRLSNILACRQGWNGLGVSAHSPFTFRTEAHREVGARIPKARIHIERQNHVLPAPEEPV